VNQPGLSITDLLGLGFVAVFTILIVAFIFIGRNHPSRSLREILTFKKLKRGIGLAVEAGQRLHISLGHGSLDGQKAASGLIGLSVLERVARVASISDLPPIASSGEGNLSILSQDTLKSAYAAINAEDQYDPLSGQLSGLTPFSFASGTLPLIYDQHTSVNILMGSFGTELALIADVSERVGSITLAGSENLSAQAIIYATAQEPLIGEELFAAGAYLNAGPAHASSLRAQDLLRWVIIGVIIIGSFFKLVGVL